MTSQCSVCEIDPKVKELVKKFRLRKEKDIAAIVLKVDAAKQLIVLDEEYEDTTIEEVVNDLPPTQPRYVILSYVYKQTDGRVSYPLIFVYCCPSGCQTHQSVMYAGSKNAFINETQLTKVFHIREVEEFTESFILDELEKLR